MRWVVWGIVIVVLVCGCRQPEQPEPDCTGGVFKMVLSSAVESLDPHGPMYLSDVQAGNLVFEGLVGLGTDQDEIVGLLAESWQCKDEGRTFIFVLRPDVRFHDDPCFVDGGGRVVTAQDVAYSIHRMADHGQGRDLFLGRIRGFDAYLSGAADHIAGIDVIDDRHIAFSLTRPFVSFLKTLASREAVVVPREAIDFYGENASRHPVGTGPFRLAQWLPLQALTFVRNEHYWRRDDRGHSLPYLDGVEMVQSVHESQAMGAFLKGETHLLRASQEDVEAMKSRLGADEPGWKTIEIEDPGIRFLGFSLLVETPLANHEELRRAVAMSFDRQTFKSMVRHVQFTPAMSLAPGLDSETGVGIPFDPEQACRIFARFGTELTGRGVTLRANREYPSLNLLADGLRRCGVTTHIDTVSVKYYESIFDQKPDLFRLSFVPSYPDLEQYYGLFYSRNIPDVNMMGYACQEYDELYEKALVTSDRTARRTLFARLERLLTRDVPAVYVTNRLVRYVLLADEVQGFQMRFLSPDLGEVWLGEAAQGSTPADQSPK